MKQRVLVYGSGMLGKQVSYLFSTYTDNIEIVGYVDDFKPEGTAIENDLKVVGSFAEVSCNPLFSPDKVKFVFAIGYSKMALRYEAYKKVKESGYSFESFIHPKATVEKNVTVGEGTCILAGAIVDQYVKIAPVNYLDIGVMIGENTVLGDNNYLAAGVAVGGSVSIGTSNFFGLQSTVVNDITIGNRNSIDAKSLVYKNLKDDSRLVELHEQHILT